MTITIDYSNMLRAGGIPGTEWAAAGDDFSRAWRGFEDLRQSGVAGFPDVAVTDRVRQVDVRRVMRDVIVLGIGGSALGPIALRTALRPSGWNLMSDAARDEYPRLHVLDNVDPETIGALLDRVDLRRTFFIVTSKSGGTAETMSQFLIVHERVTRAGLKLQNHFVFVTDPEAGALRELSKVLGIGALDIAPNVGGRFSVLTPVGLAPAAMIGIDVDKLVEGARDMATRCREASLSENPAGVYATLMWLADTRHGKSINVMMPYSDQLRDFAAWFVQLWAESLGKTRDDGTFAGQTPLAALGATDQHSQVQLFMEGPTDKVVTFIAVSERDTDLTIPHSFQEVKELGYLGGHTLGELIDVEQRATAGALAVRGRPNLTIHLDRVDAWHVGGLIMLLELATAYAGQLYGIDAFNQPGVELGKQFAYALLGRPGAEAAMDEWKSLPTSDSRFIV